MKYQDAMEYIERCSQYGIVPGLETIKELLRRLGNPQKELKFIHIAGTNGKGSTLAFISSILTENGYKTGRYISPVVIEYREKYQIQGKSVSKAMIGRLMETVAAEAEKMRQEGFSHPTPFEIETALAFLLFREKNVTLWYWRREWEAPWMPPILLKTLWFVLLPPSAWITGPFLETV